MKKTLNFTLFAALMLSCFNMSAGASTKNQSTPVNGSKKTSRAKSIETGWSFKTKAIAALSVVAAGAIAFAIYKHKLSKQPSDLDKLFASEQQNNAPAYQIPAGPAGQLMHYLQAHSENFQIAVRNPVRRANIEQLFNNQNFIAHMDGRFGAHFRQQLIELFNDQAIVFEATLRNDFVERSVAMLDRQWLFANT